jgi:uncharacterized protein YdaU (DUF1376 family)
MNFYPRHLGDYARDAGYLSQSEHGAYTLLLDWYYANEKPVPPDLVFDITKAASRGEKKAAEKVLRRFFVYDGKVWTHKRVESELAKMREKSEKARGSAKSRWMRTHSERNADAMLSNNQYPISNNQGAVADYPAQPRAATGKAGTSRISKDSILSIVEFSEREKA